MNDESTSNPTQHGMPSDEQMDSLLRDFFRLEIPTELNQPLRWNQFPTAAATASLEVSEKRTRQSQSRSVRTVAVVTSVAAMALAILVVISAKNSSPMHGGSTANGTMDLPQESPVTDRPMLVSPQGDSRTSTDVITPDGVTLEETDSIKLHQ